MEIQETPRYRLLQPWYAPGDQFIAEDTVVEHDLVPNEAMEPLNDAARAKMTEYLKTLQGGKTPRVEDLIYHAMLNRPREAGDVVLPHAVRDVPQQGHLAKPGESGVRIAEPPRADKPVRKLMGTVIKEGVVPPGEHSL